jgi:hypothetical protein
MRAKGRIVDTGETKHEPIRGLVLGPRRIEIARSL